MGTWRVASYVDSTTRALVTDVPDHIGVIINQDVISWGNACERWNAPYTADGHRLTIGVPPTPPPNPHDIWCPGYGDDHDENLARTVPRATWFERRGDTLTLSDTRGGRALVTLQAPAPPAPDPHDATPGQGPCGTSPFCAHEHGDG